MTRRIVCHARSSTPRSALRLHEYTPGREAVHHVQHFDCTSILLACSRTSYIIAVAYFFDFLPCWKRNLPSDPHFRLLSFPVDLTRVQPMKTNTVACEEQQRKPLHYPELPTLYMHCGTKSLIADRYQIYSPRLYNLLTQRTPRKDVISPDVSFITYNYSTQPQHTSNTPIPFNVGVL